MLIPVVIIGSKYDIFQVAYCFVFSLCHMLSLRPVAHSSRNINFHDCSMLHCASFKALLSEFTFGFMSFQVMDSFMQTRQHYVIEI